MFFENFFKEDFNYLGIFGTVDGFYTQNFSFFKDNFKDELKLF